MNEHLASKNIHNHRNTFIIIILIIVVANLTQYSYLKVNKSDSEPTTAQTFQIYQQSLNSPSASTANQDQQSGINFFKVEITKYQSVNTKFEKQLKSAEEQLKKRDFQPAKIDFHLSELKTQVDINLLKRINSHNQKTRINLKPVKLLGNYKGTIIVAFSDINYWPAAQLWFQRMKTLNYDNVRMYALDKLAYKKMLAEIDRGFMKPENVYFPTAETIKIKNKFKVKDRAGDLNKVWKMRVDVTRKLLKQGYSVLQSDIDSLWLKHVDLDTLPLNFDIIQSTAEKFPDHIVRQWGFALCGCLVLYRPTEATLKWWDLYTTKCRGCDDQRLTNDLYMKLGMSWLETDELSVQNEVWEGPISYHTIGVFDGKGPSGVIGLGRKTLDLSNLQLGVVDKRVWMRGGELSDCDGSKNETIPWIMNPIIAKRGNKKVQMFEDYKTCF